MERFRVNFKTDEFINRGNVTIKQSGIVIDRYSDTINVSQRVASGQGGTIEIDKVKIAVDFYLILGDNGKTYNIRCSEVILERTL